jgi:stage II sporulation protein D
MVKFLSIISALFLGFLINCVPYIQKSSYEGLVRVAILTDMDSLRVSGYKDNKYFEDYKIKIGDKLPVIFNPKDGKISVNGRLYYGNLEIKYIRNKIWVINILKIEDYLKGVVPCELGIISKNLIEAAKAQAVAARTYTYAHLYQYEEFGFDLYATVRDQEYKGIECEDPVVNEAIIKTRGQILTYENKPIDAKYHSTCGGYTADFNDAWKGSPVPYLRSVKCDFCRESPHYEWKKVMSKKEFFFNLRRRLNGIGISLPDTELIKGIRLRRNKKSKRIVEAEIITRMDRYTIPQYNIRKIFGSEDEPGGLLKSNNFNIFVKNDSIIIEGRGLGHGVGMCQFGAIGMAKSGKNYKEILRHYYPGTKLARAP